MRTLRTLIVAALGLVLLTPTGVAGAAVPDEVLAAMQRDLGLTAAEARRWTDDQAAATELNAALAARLGPDLVGSWFDGDAGALVVAVTSATRAREVRAAGAVPRVVANGRAELEAVERKVTAVAAEDRSVLAVGIDPRANAVVATVRTGSTVDLSRYGGAVRIAESAAAPQPAVDRMDGGDRISTGTGGCSAGFNLRAGGTGYLLTAGHCRPGGGDDAVYGDGSVYFGPFVASSYPGDDYALVRNDNPANWTQQATITNYGSTTSPTRLVWGVQDSPVGAAICKSGVTTGVTCGVIDVKDETVFYPDGTLRGLTRHTACVEPGDSGGSSYSTRGNQSTGIQTYAEGITSGTALSDGHCLQFSGQRNQGWFQPVGEALTAYGNAFGASIMTVTA